jgi:ribonuclease D
VDGYPPDMTNWVRTPEQLARLAQSLAGASALALDTESDSLHHHVEKVCLVQLATDRGDACLVDPLALRDLSPLAPVMADRGVAKVLHGADYDVTTLKRDFGFRFAGLFDTMIAARFLGRPQIGLQALAQAELGVALSKESQRDDWSRRPLTPTQEQYALADVAHLLILQARLTGELRQLGRLSWVEEESDAVAALEPARRGREPDAYQKVKGMRRLSRRQQAVLREIYGWRESLAETTDVPAFKLLSSEALIEMAERAPRSAAELAQVRGLSPRVRSRGEELLSAIGRALDLPESELPRLGPPPPRPVLSEAVRKRIESLRTWRTKAAAGLAVDVSVVLPQRLLERLAQVAPREVEALGQIEGLRRWRVQSFGGELIAALGV